MIQGNHDVRTVILQFYFTTKMVIIVSLYMNLELMMFNMKLRALLLTSVLALTACSGQNNQQNQTNDNPAATLAPDAASNPMQANTVTLKSSDGKISINTSGDFADKMQDAELLPEGVEKNKVVLLQQDKVTGTTLYVVHVGATKKPADYFAKLKSAIEADKSLINVNISAASANRMSYQFSQTDADGNPTLNEQCVVVMHGEPIYNVCANNPESNQKELTAALTYINTEN